MVVSSHKHLHATTLVRLSVLWNNMWLCKNSCLAPILPIQSHLHWVDATLCLKVVNFVIHPTLEYWHTRLSGTNALMTHCMESVIDHTVPSIASTSSNSLLHRFWSNIHHKSALNRVHSTDHQLCIQRTFVVPGSLVKIGPFYPMFTLGEIALPRFYSRPPIAG